MSSPSRPFASRGQHRRRARSAQSPRVLDGLEADARAARELLDDLAALVEAGLVVPAREGAAVRYAVADDVEHRAQR